MGITSNLKSDEGRIVAQTGRGQVAGVVMDQAGGVISGVEVTITNVETNATKTTITSEVGKYVFGSVSRGSYTISNVIPGFSIWNAKIELQAVATATHDITPYVASQRN